MSLRGLVFTCRCKGCGAMFESDHPRRSACSEACVKLRWSAKYERAGARMRAANSSYKRANRGRCSERERLRKAKVRAGDRIDRDELFALHEGRCGICGELIEGAFEVDHRLPLSRGGEHTMSNVQPAHPMCNRRKYNHEESKSL